MTSNKIIDTARFFPNLTDKNMLNKIKLYDILYSEHENLEHRMQCLYLAKVYNQKASDYLSKSKLYFNYLKQDIEMLKSIYKTCREKDFLDKTKAFQNFVSNWYNVLKQLHTFVLKLEKENNKIKGPENTR